MFAVELAPLVPDPGPQFPTDRFTPGGPFMSMVLGAPHFLLETQPV
jgi:hypothetical protein